MLGPADKGKQDVTRLLGAVVLRSNTTISIVALFLALDVGGGKGGLGGRAVRGFPPILRPHVPGANENLDTDCSPLVGGGCFLFLYPRLYLSIMPVKLLGSTLPLKRSVENLTCIMTK